MPKKKKMILKREVPDRFVGGKWFSRIEEFEVTVMAIADRYAMVRRPGCVPFVEPEQNLREKEDA